MGFGEPNRLILKDETQTVIKRLQKRTKASTTGTSTQTTCRDPSTEGADSPSSSDQDDQLVRKSTGFNCHEPTVQYPDVDDSSEWYPSIAKVQMTPAYEQSQVALFCCRETVNLRTMSWIMADDKWIELLPEMMARSEALTSVIHANASTYLAKAAGADTTPRQALTHYAYALKELQRDLYDPLRQTSDETLFAIILLGVFDVLRFWKLVNPLATQQSKPFFLADPCKRSYEAH